MRTVVASALVAPLLLASRLAFASDPAVGLGLPAGQAALLRTVMEFNQVRAAAQVASNKVAIAQSAAEQARVGAYVASKVEVITSINPLRIIDMPKQWKTGAAQWSKWRSVAAAIAETMELRSVHETQMSDVGRETDGPKRAFAELGYFFPPGSDFWNGAACSHNCADDATLRKVYANVGVQNAKLLPKYAALNLFGRFDSILNEPGPGAVEKAPVTFVYRHGVKNRMTVTSGDSLREWCSGSSNYNALKGEGFFVQEGQCPGAPGVQPWNAGPVGVYDDEGTGSRLVHVLARRGFMSKLLTFLDDPAKVIRESLGPRPKARPEAGDNYVEVQVHGPVRVDRDIVRVYANFWNLFGNPLFEPLYKKLLASDIQIVWYYRPSGKPTFDHVLAQARNWKQIEDQWKAVKAKYAARLDEMQGLGWEKMLHAVTKKPVAVTLFAPSDALQDMVPPFLAADTLAAWDALVASGRVKKLTTDEWAQSIVTAPATPLAEKLPAVEAEMFKKNQQRKHQQAFDEVADELLDRADQLVPAK